MKQSWQRLPGLDNGTVSLANSSHTSDSTSSVDADHSPETIRQELESIPFEAFILRRAKLDSRLEAAGFVWEDGRKVETETYIRKGVVTNPKRERKSNSMPGSHQASRAGSRANTPSRPQTTASASKQPMRSKSMPFKSQTGTEAKNPSSQTGTKAKNWKRSSHNSSGTRQGTSHAAFVSRTLVRMVLNIPGYTIQHCANMTEFLRGFQGAIEGEIACKKTTLANVYLEHEKCYRKGIVQRDVSTNNIIVSNGEGHLIDFDHAKFTGQFKSVPNGVSEKIEKRFRKPFLSMFDEAVISRAEEMMGDPAKALVYLGTLIQGIEVVEPLTLQDLGWCEEVNVILLWEAD